MEDNKDITISTIQVNLRHTRGKTVHIGRRIPESDLNSYRKMIEETLTGVGLDVECVSITYDDIPEGQKMVPVPIADPPKQVKKPIEDNTTEEEIEHFISRKPNMK